jgi:hypothetical protein
MQEYFKTQFWGTPIDFINSAYVQISFSVIMNLYAVNWLNGGQVMSNVYMILNAIGLVVYPLWLYFFLSKHY